MGVLIEKAVKPFFKAAGTLYKFDENSASIAFRYERNRFNAKVVESSDFMASIVFEDIAISKSNDQLIQDGLSLLNTKVAGKWVMSSDGVLHYIWDFLHDDPVTPQVFSTYFFYSLAVVSSFYESIQMVQYAGISMKKATQKIFKSRNRKLKQSKLETEINEILDKKHWNDTDN